MWSNDENALSLSHNISKLKKYFLMNECEVMLSLLPLSQNNLKLKYISNEWMWTNAESSTIEPQ